jgi:mono/diheme cytochrome c family protein
MAVVKLGLALLLSALALVFAGCGGDDDEGAATTSGGAAATEPATTEPAATGGAEAADGAAVFASAGCGNCHTLKAADATGSVGPNLDELMPDEEQVAAQVANGGGGMPAFGDQLSDAEIEAVAQYVSQNAGQ